MVAIRSSSLKRRDPPRRTMATVPSFTRRSRARGEMLKNRAASFGVKSRVGSGWVDSAITFFRMEFRQTIGGLAGGDLGGFLASGLAAEQTGKFRE